MSLEVLGVQAVTLLLVAIYGGFAPRTTFALRSYYLTQAFYVVGCFGAQLFLKNTDHRFAIIYSLLTALMLSWVAVIAYLYVFEHPLPLLLVFAAFALSILPAWLMANENTPVTLAGWINLFEGAVLIGLGFVTGMAASAAKRLHWTHRRVALTFAVMWILLGMFRHGYRAHWDIPRWETANRWLPWLVTCIGMGLNARAMNRYSNFLSYERSEHPQNAEYQE